MTPAHLLGCHLVGEIDESHHGSLARCARAMGVSRQRLRALITGQGEPTVRTLEAAARLLGRTLDETRAMMAPDSCGTWQPRKTLVGERLTGERREAAMRQMALVEAG